MVEIRKSCAVAFIRERNNATDAALATIDATAIPPNARKPLSLQELRAQLRAQLVRNQIAERETEIPAELRTPETATAPDEPGNLAAGVMTPEAEARRRRVLAMLAENPEARYAMLAATHADPDAVLLTLAIRGRATCELRIPRDRYDPFLLLDLIERHGGTVH